ncbi:MAG: hypothetical protein AB7O62_07820 [Pirellulales bacterium]
MRPWKLCGLLLVGAALLAVADDEPPATIKQDKAALAALQSYVGEWKGVGQIRRGKRSDGDWAEQAEWAWQFKDGRAAIVFEADESKYYQSGRIQPGDKTGEFVLIGTLADGTSEERFTGTANDDGKVVFVADEPAEGRPAQISLRQVADGARMLMTYEKRLGKETYSRLAEVGYTRKGSGFGKGNNGPECVVTGGYGTMTVEYEGKTYYVCCTGCRDLFNEDPAGVIAEYLERKKQEREER